MVPKIPTRTTAASGTSSTVVVTAIPMPMASAAAMTIWMADPGVLVTRHIRWPNVSLGRASPSPSPWEMTGDTCSPSELVTFFSSIAPGSLDKREVAQDLRIGGKRRGAAGLRKLSLGVRDEVPPVARGKTRAAGRREAGRGKSECDWNVRKVRQKTRGSIYITLRTRPTRPRVKVHVRMRHRFGPVPSLRGHPECLAADKRRAARLNPARAWFGQGCE